MSKKKISYKRNYIHKRIRFYDILFFNKVTPIGKHDNLTYIRYDHRKGGEFYGSQV